MVRRFARKARDEYGLLAVLQHRAGDAEYLLLRLARAVDDLRHALADAAVHVHLGVFTDLLEGPHLQLQRGASSGLTLPAATLSSSWVSSCLSM